MKKKHANLLSLLLPNFSRGVCVGLAISPERLTRPVMLIKEDYIFADIQPAFAYFRSAVYVWGRGGAEERHIKREWS